MAKRSTMSPARRKAQPFTGREYLESLRDGRVVWIEGERVEDVTAHPAFRNGARMIARLYDALHDPELRDRITVPLESGFTHRFFEMPRSAEALRADRDAIVASSRITFGWMGRTPDYKAALLATLAINADFYHPFEDNARAWHRRAQERVLFFNHALVHPPTGRARPAEESIGLWVRAETETAGGLVVSGAKVVSTGAAFTHYNFVAHTGSIPRADQALAFIVQMNAPGVQMICRPSYEGHAARLGGPFDHPLASRLDENDAILVLDRVKIPWENVFICGDVDKASQFLSDSMFVPRALFHGCARLGVKLDFLVGLVSRAAAAIGQLDNGQIQGQIGELVGWRNLVWALGDAMVANPTPWLGGTVLPNTEHSFAFRFLATTIYPKLMLLIQQVLGSGLVYVNSSAVDFKVPALRRYLDRYLRGVDGVTSVERVKLMRLAWDAIGTEFGSRHELYERVHSGGGEVARMQLYREAGERGTLASCGELVDRFLSEYDLDGWLAPDLADAAPARFRSARGAAQRQNSSSARSRPRRVRRS